MSDLTVAMIARLQAASAVAAIVGTKIYWIQRPQGEAIPSVVLRYVGSEQDDPLEGEADLIETRVQADCFGVTNVQAKALARAVKAAVKPPATQGGFEFYNADVSGPVDLGEPGVTGFEHRASLDILVRHGAES